MTRYVEMKSEAMEETELTRQIGIVGKDDIPLCRVVADVSWAKLSYRCISVICQEWSNRVYIVGQPNTLVANHLLVGLTQYFILFF